MVLWLWWTAPVVSILIVWAVTFWRTRRFRELAKLIPCPTPFPIIGNAHLFLTKPEETLEKVTSLINRYGNYTGFWIGSDFNMIVKDPADIKLLLTSNKVNQKGPAYKYMLPFIGPGILTGGPTWRNHRKIATPCYGKKAIQCFENVVNVEAQQLAEVLSSKNPDLKFDVYPDVVSVTTQCVCQTLMGLSKDDSQNVRRMEEVVMFTQNVYNFVFENMTKWWLQVPLLYWLLGQKKKEDYYAKASSEMISDIVEKRRKVLEEKKKSILENNEDIINIIDRYILCGELTSEEISMETFSLFTTSQEAAAKITCGVLVFLAHLPVWQDKVYNEITEVMGTEDRAVTEDDLKQLYYLDMVYKEVLRYLPIAAFIQRSVEEDIPIKNGEIVLPAGTTLMIPLHQLHRDPLFWENPDEADPGRFRPENVKKRDPNVFIPFSLGAMDCLGSKLNKKGPSYKYMEPFLGPGILTGGPTWRNHRKIAGTSFGKKAFLRLCEEVFNAETEQLLHILSSKDPAVQFNIYSDVVTMTTQCVCQTLFGLSKQESQNLPHLRDFIDLTPSMYEHIYARITKWWLQIPLVYWLLAKTKIQNEFIKNINEVLSEVVKHRRRGLRENNITSLEENDEDNALSMIDRFILCGDMSDQEIIWESATLFTGSQETTAKITSALLLFLAHLPDWQEKVYNEILDVLGPEDKPVTKEDLNRLRYLDMVYKETLRYMPIGVFMQRVVEEDIAIKNGEIILPAGTMLLIPLHHMHRDPRFWEDPDEVDPNRFSPENVKKRDPNTYLPFSLGPVDCLGQNYGTVIIKTVVVWVVRRMVLRAEGRIRDLELHAAISMKFAKGYNVHIRPRLTNQSK